MMAQPQSAECTLLIERIEPDPVTDGKFLFSGRLLSAEASVKDNSFYANDRQIKGFAFNLSAEIKEGTTVRAIVSFTGDPFVQTYELKDVKPA